MCVLQSKLQKASKSQCSTRNSQRAQKLSAKCGDQQACVCVYVCVCVLVLNISASVRSRPSAPALQSLGAISGAGGLPRRLDFGCMCAKQVFIAPAVSAVLPYLCLVP